MADDDSRTAVEEQDPEASAARPADGEQREESAEGTDWKAESRKWERQAKANADAAQRLTAIEESQKTEQQKLADRLAAAEKRATDAELKVLRAEVASAKGIPATLASRLQGATREDLEADADELLKSIPTSKQAVHPDAVAGPNPGTGASANGSQVGREPRDIFASLLKGG